MDEFVQSAPVAPEKPIRGQPGRTQDAWVRGYADSAAAGPAFGTVALWVQLPNPIVTNQTIDHVRVRALGACHGPE